MKTVAALIAIAAWHCRAGADVTPWERWEQDANRTCPGHHITWLYGDAYADLPYAFNDTLTPRMRSRIKKLADEKHRCADEKMGFYCEMSANLSAYVRLNILHDFTEFTCSHVRCEAAASCSKVPGEAQPAQSDRP